MTKPKRSIKRMSLVLLGMLVILVVSLVIYLNNPLSYRGVAVDEPTTLPDLPKQKIGDVPIITVEGSPYQMGYQHGLLLQREIQEMVQTLHTVTGQTPTPQGWAKSTYLNYLALSYFRSIPERYQQEMRGLAKGAGVPLRDIILMNSYDDIFQLSQCTSLAVWGRYTRNGQIIHGRNLDYLLQDQLWNRQVVFVFKPEEGYPFLSVTWPGVIGVLTGMNQAGLALGALSSNTPKDSINGVPLGILYREIMQFSQTFSDAEAILNQRKRTTGNNLILTSSKERKGIVFELTPDQVVARSGDGLLGVANHFNQLKDENSPEFLQESTYRQHRVEQLAKETFAKSKPMAVKEMIQILDDQVIEPGTRMIANSLNIQSVVFLPNRREMWVSINHVVPAAAGAFVGFRFTPDLPNPMQYLGATRVQRNYLQSQAWFWAEDPAHWTDDTINTIFARYLERDADPLYFMYEEAQFFAMVGRFEEAADLYETLLHSIHDHLHCETGDGIWFTLPRERIEVALGKVYCGMEEWEKAWKLAENNLSDLADEEIRKEAVQLAHMINRRKKPTISDVVLLMNQP